MWLVAYSLIFFVEGVQCINKNTEDFYELLEIPRTSTTADIKKSYRNLSKKYHPDKNPGDEDAATHYKKINRAYEVLSDENKRGQYDQGGIDGLERFER
jgi:curved DNA-binding protein CbpA